MKAALYALFFLIKQKLLNIFLEHKIFPWFIDHTWTGFECLFKKNSMSLQL